MPSIVFASNFLAGSLISLLLPTGLLIAIVVWWSLVVAKRVPKDMPTSSTRLPPSEVVAAAPPSETGITPAEPPPEDA
jgi:hypothetical protein